MISLVLHHIYTSYAKWVEPSLQPIAMQHSYDNCVVCGQQACDKIISHWYDIADGIFDKSNLLMSNYELNCNFVWSFSYLRNMKPLTMPACVWIIQISPDTLQAIGIQWYNLFPLWYSNILIALLWGPGIGWFLWVQSLITEWPFWVTCHFCSAHSSISYYGIFNELGTLLQCVKTSWIAKSLLWHCMNIEVSQITSNLPFFSKPV